MTGRPDWYECLKSDPALKDLYKYVTTAGNHIKRRGEAVTIDKINGELTPSFPGLAVSHQRPDSGVECRVENC